MMMENIDFRVRNDYAAKLIGELSEAEITLLDTYYSYNLSLEEDLGTIIYPEKHPAVSP